MERHGGTLPVSSETADGRTAEAICTKAHQRSHPACGNTLSNVTATDDRAWTTPRVHAWVTGTGRSPDFRVNAPSSAFPNVRTHPVASWKEARRLQLRGQLRDWPDGRTAFPFHPPEGETRSEHTFRGGCSLGQSAGSPMLGNLRSKKFFRASRWFSERHPGPCLPRREGRLRADAAASRPHPPGGGSSAGRL